MSGSEAVPAAAEPPRISVAVVTYGREPLLPLVLEAFDAQTYPANARRLAVLDDSPAPCAWLAELACRRDDVRYLHLPGRLTVGAKRNRILELLDGELVSQWDDDDYYAPGYLDFVAGQLADADFVKLDRWFVHDLVRGTLSRWDTRQAPAALPPEAAPGWIERNRLGYGFCHSYRRTVLEAVQSPDTSVGDDYAFARAVVDAGYRVRLLPDQQGLALHLLHRGNLSRCFPDEPLDPALLGTLFPGFPAARYRAALARCQSAFPLPG